MQLYMQTRCWWCLLHCRKDSKHHKRKSVNKWNGTSGLEGIQEPEKHFQMFHKGGHKVQGIMAMGAECSGNLYQMKAFQERLSENVFLSLLLQYTHYADEHTTCSMTCFRLRSGFTQHSSLHWDTCSSTCFDIFCLSWLSAWEIRLNVIWGEPILGPCLSKEKPNMCFTYKALK